MAKSRIVTKPTSPNKFHHPIYLFQSPETRALNVGHIQGKSFLPGRLLFGPAREDYTYQATMQSFQLPEIAKLLKKYKPSDISTITLLRETLACRLGSALYDVGIHGHFGDAFIGANHVKNGHDIKTAYSYENIEGLTKSGLWIIADSICMGRNLASTLASLLTQFKPQEMLFIAPIASRIGIDILGEILDKYQVPATFVAWGALFGVDEKTRYNMPWGHKDTEPVDVRDQQTFISMYHPELCMGGDFGNNYYCPPLALDLYHAQLKELGITPKIPTVAEIQKIYSPEEIITL